MAISISTLPTAKDCPASERLHPEVPLFEFGGSVDVIRTQVHGIVYAFDLDSGLLSFNAYAPPDQFDEFNRQVQRIIESLTIP